MAKKILITGAEGQLGQALQTILADHYTVLPTTRKPAEIIFKYRNVVEMDIANLDSVSNTINSFHPDIIINCAAYSDVDGNEINKKLSHQVNVEGLSNLLQASDKDIYIIQISSDYVFDGANGPYDEEDHTFPVNYYGKSKLEAENILRGSRRKWAIFRPNVIYSDDLFCNANFFSWVYKSLLKENAISVITDQISNPTYMKDIVNSIFQCILLSYEGILHIGSDDYISRYEFALKIAEIFEFDKTLIIPIDTNKLSVKMKSYIAERPKHSGLKTDKIERELNISTYSTSYSLKLLKNILNL